jgi:hypothetical protein
MKPKQWMFAAILAALSALPGVSATLSVSANVTPNAGLFNYAYQFTIADSGSNVDNIFLGSDDISPLNVVLKINGQPTSTWSWLGNDTPQNYLQFFDLVGSALGNGKHPKCNLLERVGPARFQLRSRSRQHDRGDDEYRKRGTRTFSRRCSGTR